MVLQTHGDGPEATGGTAIALLPWELDEEALTPVGYEYIVGKSS